MTVDLEALPYIVFLDIFMNAHISSIILDMAFYPFSNSSWVISNP
jgi:hypothetical protein